MDIVNLVLILHNHQPVGNFDVVFEQAYQKAYAPFLEVLAKHKGVRVGLHTSGPLLEWLEERRPEYVARLRERVAAGQVEIVGGAYYEPILTMLPPRDRVGQVRAFTAHLENLFPGKVRGMWLAERVWEQALAGDLADAGIEFTALDDFHFKAAGLRDHELLGSYLTEDRGRTLRVFPGSERLRYLIPFGTVDETIAYMRSAGQGEAGGVGAAAGSAGRAPMPGAALLCYADDGEKFGLWPQTHKHVYTNGWLDRFFTALEANAEWIRILTPSECLQRLDPLGTLYLPDCSYREMTEWVLPAERLAEYEAALDHLKRDERLAALRPFIRGGTWRNFKFKYTEAMWMYGRALEVSDHLEEAARKMGAGSDFGALSEIGAGPHFPAGEGPRKMGTGTISEKGVGNGASPQFPRKMGTGTDFGKSAEIGASPHFPALAEARQALYRAQCNCPYWHGVFGGLYLPHLREATYTNLIAAQTALDRAQFGPGPWAVVRRRDVDLDGFEEIELVNPNLAAVLKPSRGGHLVELDLARWRTNVLATLTRRREAYHRTLSDAVAKGAIILSADAEKASDDQVHSIHDITRVKEYGLEKRLIVDRCERESLIDHCFAPGTTLAAVMEGTYEELGTFVRGRYEKGGESEADDPTPSPLRGEGWGEGRDSTTPDLHPHPNPLPERERGTSPSPLRGERGGEGRAFSPSPYPLPGRERDDQVQVRLRSVGRLAGPEPRALHVQKTVTLRADAPGLTIDYALHNPAAWPLSILFGVEFNFGMLAGQASDRYYRLGRETIGNFSVERDLAEVVRLELVDDWRDLCVQLDLDVAAAVWLYPVETVSVSEAGFERVYQASCVIPHWSLDLAPEATWQVRLTLAAVAAKT